MQSRRPDKMSSYRVDHAVVTVIYSSFHFKGPSVLNGPHLGEPALRSILGGTVQIPGNLGNSSG